MLKPEPDIRNTDELLAFHKAIFGGARMEDPPKADPPKEDPPKTDPPKEEKLLPQSEVNRIAATEKEQGKQAALREVQEALGVDLDTAKSILKEHNERTEAQKSEATKAREAADAEKTAAAKEREDAAKEIHEARLARAFAGLGVADDAKVSRYGKLVDAAPGASYEDVKKAVEKLKEEEPALFGGKVEDPPKRTPAPSSDPKGSPPKPKTDEDAFSRGMARAQGHRSAFTAQVHKTST